MRCSAQRCASDHDRWAEREDVVQVFQRREAEAGCGAIDERVAGLVEVWGAVCQEPYCQIFACLLGRTDYEQHSGGHGGEVGSVVQDAVIQEYGVDDAGRYGRCHSEQEGVNQQAAGTWAVNGPPGEEPEPEYAGRKSQQWEGQRLQIGRLFSDHDGVADDVVHRAFIAIESDHEVSETEDQERYAAGEMSR